MTEIMAYMSNIDHISSIVGSTETWLNPNNTSTFGIAYYKYVGLTRHIGRVGGVSLWISDDIVYSEL